MFIGMFGVIFAGKYLGRVFVFVFEGEYIGGVRIFIWYIFL